MSILPDMVALTGTMPVAETYRELLHSRSHWLFELTLEVASAPLAFAAGWLWRNGLLRHLHRDLHALQHDVARPCVDPTSASPVARQPTPRVVDLVPPPAEGASATGPAERLSVSWFSMPFGLAGLGTTWAYAADHQQAPAVVGTALLWVSFLLFSVSFLLWLLLLSAYARQAARRRRNLVDDLQDPTAGPFTALALLTPLLLTVGALGDRPDLARPVFDVLTALVVVLAGWLTGQWIYRPLQLDRLHPGYLLPSVAGGYVASTGAAALGQPRLAGVMFGLASVSWLVLGALVLGRLMFRPALPAALLPTMAIEVAPAALAGVAWFSLNGSRVDPVAAGLLGYGLLMLVAQLRLLPAYRRLTFSASSWAFTFPAAAVAMSAMRWLTVTDPVGAGVFSAVVLVAVTLLVALISTRTAIALRRGELRPPVPATRTSRPTQKEAA